MPQTRDVHAGTIAAWSDEFIRALQGWGDERLPSQGELLSQQSLERQGLLRADGSFTELGRTVRYHLDEYRWQEGRKGFDGLLSLGDIGPSVRALDVGCGAGQTLRRLEPDRPVELVGVDTDPTALALGMRLAAMEQVTLSLMTASAMQLPFGNASFDLVFTRVALNYMAQRTAIAEMARILRPGGYIFCRVESLWYDMFILRAARTPRSIVGRAIDLGWGVLHAATGWQPEPGRRFLGSRAFASAARLRRMLGANGCRVTYVGEAPNGPTILGRRTQLVVIARKDAR